MNRTKTALLQVNTLPVPTWRHLKMNGCDLDISFEQATFLPSRNILALEKQGVLQRISAFAQEEGGGDGKERAADFPRESLASFVRDNSNIGYRLTVREGERMQAPLMLDYLLNKGNPTLIERLVVDVGREGSVTLIKGLRTDSEGGPTFHAGSSTVHVGEGADLTLVQVRYLSEGATDLDDLSVTLADRAKFTLVEIVIGDADSYLNTHVDMIGNKSECAIGCMNVVDKQGSADFNFHVEHRGEESASTLLVRGALLDNAAKLFRGTIDFHRGCKGSRGSEDEYSLLLSPSVKNRSVPLILCAEEDVEGVHAVSSGRLDHNALFYLTSRGIDEKRAKRLLVEAQLYPILAMVSDKEVLSEIQGQLFRRLDSHVQ